MSDYANKRIAIIGMARTGLAAAEVLKGLGASVVLYDKKDAAELRDAVETARDLGVETRTGTNDVDFAGIDTLVPSPGVPRHLPMFAEAERRGVEVVAEIELAYRISKAPIIAITGTNGKTTTTVLTGRMLMADGRDTLIAGNVAAGDIRLPLITAAAHAGPASVIVAEISTFQLEWISLFRPRIAALLNVSSDHMDRHADMREYAALKARVFENQAASDFAIINSENPITAGLWGARGSCLLGARGSCRAGADARQEPRAPVCLKGRVLRFARLSEVDEGAFVRGDDLIVRLDGRETPVCSRLDICIPGEHNVENVLAASCAAIAFGARPESVLSAVREFTGVEHRLETVAVIDGVRYVNNSMCTNVDAAVRSVEAIDEPQIVIAGGKDKGSDYAPLAEAFKRKAKHVVLIGADAGLIRAAAERAGYDRTSHAGSMEDAVNRARALAEPGDVIVLTPGCASFDMFDSFEHRGRVFKQIVRDLEVGSGTSHFPTGKG